MNSNLSSKNYIFALKHIVKLAALFHDLGKSIDGFQNNLVENKTKISVVRHELISAILIQPLLDMDENESFSLFLTEKKVKEYFQKIAIPHYLEFVEELKEYCNYINSNDEYLNVQQILNNYCSISNKLLSKSFWKTHPLIQSLIFLVLSHHKLPGGKFSKGTKSRRNTSKNSISLISESMAPYFHIAKLDSVDEFYAINGDPIWNFSEWQSSVSNCFNELKQFASIFSFNIISDEDFFSDLAYLARPSLVFADYKESASKKVNKIYKKNILYANTIEISKETNVLGDTLINHLIKVANTSEEIFNEIACKKTSCYKQSLSIPFFEQPKQLTNPSILPENSPFYWQNAITSKLKQSEIANCGFFGSLISKTGAGKTKAAPQIMLATGATARFNIALGMRTLTLQTHKSYLSSLIGFNEHQVSLMIGSGAITENINSKFDIDCEIISKEKTNFKHPLSSIFMNSKQLNMINSPISVMTIDHLINATNLRSSFHCTVLLEVMCSDLILDEIDDYSAEDLVAVGKLVYLTGYYGRKVIISSATSSTTMISSLQNAYLKGYKQFQDRYQYIPEPIIAYMSHEAPYITFANKENNEQKYLDFLNNLVTKTDMSKTKHKLKIVQIAKDSWKESILAACIKLSNYWNTCVNGINVSMGFVRFNNVDNSRKFASYLLETDFDKTNDIFSNMNNYLFKIQNYHSKLDNATRTLLERSLNMILDRNGDLFNEREQIINAVNEAKKQNKSNVIIIISTTNIQETGRDHCYDWAICEPQTDKSLIQSSGRVWRHRRHLSTGHLSNIALLSRPLRSFKNFEQCWCYPGIETKSISKFDNNNYVDGTSYLVNRNGQNYKNELDLLGIQFDNEIAPLHAIYSSDVISKQLIESKITASPAINFIVNYEDSRMGAMEHVKLYNLLKSQDINKMGLGAYLNRGDCKLNALHSVVRKFRANSDSAINGSIYMSTPLLGCLEHKWVLSIGDKKESISIINAPINDPFKRIFISINQSQAIQSLCDEYNCCTDEFSEQISSTSITLYNGNKPQFYNEFFGFIDI